MNYVFRIIVGSEQKWNIVHKVGASSNYNGEWVLFGKFPGDNVRNEVEFCVTTKYVF